MKRRGELKLIRQAIRNGWDIPEVQRQRCVELVHEVLSDPDATPREKLAACRTGIEMEVDNLRYAEQQLRANRAQAGDGRED